MESDLKKPSLEMIFRLAGVLDVMPHELVRAMEGNDTPARNSHEGVPR